MTSTRAWCGGDNSDRPGFDNTFARRKYEDWSAESMQPYIQSGDYKTRRYGKMWYCPANRSPGKELQNDTGQVDHPLGGWFASDWGYFARPDLWPGHATRPEELTGSRLGDGKLIMADVLYFFNPGGSETWWFNHSETGWSVHSSGWGSPVQGREAIRGITGTNQLLNDSAVLWKGRERFNPEAMLQRAQTDRWVSSAGNGGQPHPNGNLNFW